jgi:hypothetical protein
MERHKELAEMDAVNRCAAPQMPGAAYGNALGETQGILRQQTPEECIDFLFTFHDDPDKTPHYIEIRESAKTFAKVLLRHTPGGQDRITAINKLRETVMFANACVALSGRGL